MCPDTPICVLMLLPMRFHTANTCYICVLILLYICVLIRLHIKASRPRTLRSSTAGISQP
jgi:hypothetical protein